MGDVKFTEVAKINHTTPNGYDQRWVAAINQTLKDRGHDYSIEDINDQMWNDYIGPLLDQIEQDHWDDDACPDCGEPGCEGECQDDPPCLDCDEQHPDGECPLDDDDDTVIFTEV